MDNLPFSNNAPDLNPQPNPNPTPKGPKKFSFKKLGIRILKYSGISFLVLLIIAILVPYLFKDKLIAFAKKKINENINATVDFNDVSLSMITTFPDLKFSLKGLKVTGKDQFDGVPLASMESLDFTLDLWSVWYMNDRPIEIKSFILQKPDLNIIVLQDGTANYNITKPDSTAKDPKKKSELKLKLSKYAINNGHIVYDDRAGGMYTEMNDFTHSGKGDFTNSHYTLSTATDIASWSFSYGHIPYLNKVKFHSDIALDMDMDKMKFAFKNNDIQMNDLRLNFDGYTEMPGKDIAMDIKMNAPNTKFSSVLSLVPAAYTKDFSSVKTSGSAALAGWVKGVYNAKQYPSFDVSLDVNNASFHYPSLPMGIDDINTHIRVNNPGNELDQMAIEINPFRMKLDGDPFTASLGIRYPMSDPEVKSEIHGTVNLNKLSQAYPMEGVKSLTGILKADLSVDTRLSAVEKKTYDKIKMQGHLDLKNSMYKQDGKPDVNINDINVDFTPQNVNLNNLDVKLGKSDLKMTGKLDNVLSYYAGDKTLKGNVQIFSNLFDANEWTTPAATTDKSKAGSATVAKTTETAKPKDKAAETNKNSLERLDFSGTAKFNKIVYDKYVLANLDASLNSTAAKLQHVDLWIGKSDIAADGEVRNWKKYVMGTGKIEGNLNVKSRLLDLNDMMGSSSTPAPANNTNNGGGTSPAASSEPMLVPKDIDFDLSAQVGRLLYSTYDLTNFNGRVGIHNQKVTLSGVKANMLGGGFGIDGSYATTDPKKPDFDLLFKIDQFSFKETGKAFSSMQKFAPIIDYIEGKFNTTFKMKGQLQPSLMPDLNTLYVDGLIQTIDAVVRNFKPLSEMGSKVGMASLGNMPLKNTVNFFTIENGKFSLKPFDYKWEDIAMNVSGYHGLNTDMNYNVQMNVPRAKMNGNAVTGGVNKAFDELAGQAKSKGIDLGSNEFVKFNVNVTGSMTSPKFKIQFLDAGKTLNNLKDQVVDKAKQELEKKKQELENQAKAKIQEEGDKLKAEADKKKKELEDKAKAEADKKKKELEDKAKAESDRLKKEAEQKLKDKAGGVIKGLPNPFGK